MAASSGGCSQILSASSRSCGGLLLINQLVSTYIQETQSWLQSLEDYIKHPFNTLSDKLQHLYYIIDEVEDRKLNINRIYRNLLITEFAVRHDLTEDTMVEFRCSLPRNHTRDATLAMKVDQMLEKIKEEVHLCYEENEFGYLCSKFCTSLASSKPSKPKKQN